jgi:uncharacterized protein (TIGR03083 family)
MGSGSVTTPTRATREEAEAFLAVLQSLPPQAVTACRGWTVHELIAHLASGADALANQIEAHFEGRAIPAFGSWEEREPAYQAIDDPALRRRLEEAERRMNAGFDELLKIGADAVIDQVGFGFPVSELVLHMRQEFAVHHWDLVGDDEQNDRLLAQPELLAHSVRMLGEPLLARGLQADPSPETALSVRIRCPGQPDLLLTTHGRKGNLALTSPADEAGTIDTDAGARLLLVWGRRPADSRRVRSALPVDVLSRLQTLLAGY